MQIEKAFGISLDIGVFKRVLDKHYKPKLAGDGTSWLTFIGHTTDSLWSLDLFRCESILLKSHCVMVVMDQFKRKIVGFAIHAGNPDGATLRYMFNKIISGKKYTKKFKH